MWWVRDVNDLRARLLAIAGQAQDIALLLGDVSFPESRLPYLANSIDNVSKEFGRLSVVLSQEIAREKNDAGRKLAAVRTGQ